MASTLCDGPEWPPSYETMKSIVEEAATIGCQFELVFSAAIAHILQKRGYKRVTNEKIVHVGLGDEVVHWEHRGHDGRVGNTIDIRVDVYVEHEPGMCVVIEVKTDTMLKNAAVKQALTYWRHLERQGTHVEKAFVVAFQKPGKEFDFRQGKDAIEKLEQQDVFIEELSKEIVPVEKLTQPWSPTQPKDDDFRSELESVATDVAEIGHPTSERPFAVCIAYLLYHRLGYSVTLEEKIPVQLNGEDIRDTDGNVQRMNSDILMETGKDSTYTLIKVVFAQKVMQLHVKRALSCRQQLLNQGKKVSEIYFVLFEMGKDQNEQFKGNILERFLRSHPLVRTIAIPSDERPQEKSEASDSSAVEELRKGLESNTIKEK